MAMVGGGIVAVAVGVNVLVGVKLGSTMVGVGDGMSVGVAVEGITVGVTVVGIIVGEAGDGGRVGELMATCVGEFAGRVATSAIVVGDLDEKGPTV